MTPRSARGYTSLSTLIWNEIVRGRGGTGSGREVLVCILDLKNGGALDGSIRRVHDLESLRERRLAFLVEIPSLIRLGQRCEIPEEGALSIAVGMLAEELEQVRERDSVRVRVRPGQPRV